MLLIPCPYCGPRAEVEFRYAGEAHMLRPGPGAAEEVWTEYLHMRGNRRGRHAERWAHVHGCSQFFNAVRDTYTDQFECSYPARAARPAAGREI